MSEEPEIGGTQIRASLGCLFLVRGLPGAQGSVYPLKLGQLTIGRSPECDIHIPEPGVSRHHADLLWEGADLILHHRSGVNSTRVNGKRITERQKLVDGDVIQLAEKVTLRLELDLPGAVTRPSVPAEGSTLAGIDPEEITRKVRVRSFLDIDVVDSFGLKSGKSKAEDIVISFEKFRALIGHTVEEFDGQVLNSNGDEVMCCFDSAMQAMRSASAILNRLGEFNTKVNRLPEPFRVRVGVHTGRAPVDLERGIAYSQALDITGHLQKRAAINGVLVSEDTVRALPQGLPFKPVGKLLKDGVKTYRPLSDFG